MNAPCRFSVVGAALGVPTADARPCDLVCRIAGQKRGLHIEYPLQPPYAIVEVSVTTHYPTWVGNIVWSFQ